MSGPSAWTALAALLTIQLACWFLAVAPGLAQAAPKKQDSLSYNQDRLIRNLFRYYEKAVVAQLKSRAAVVVSIAFTLTQINNLDEKSQVLTTTAWMEVLWTDERLAWDPREYNGTKSIVVPPEYMWLPDIGLQNSAHEIYHNSLVDKKFKVTLFSNGNVLWTPGGKFYTNCELNIDYFPFDDQRCILHFTNWAYNGNEMNLTVTHDAVKLDNYQINGEWDIISTTAHRVDKYYACCGDVPYPSVYFTIHLRRKYLYYVMNVIAPCIMLSVLVTLVFYLPSGTGEKISLGVTIFLAFIIFLLMVAESIPQNSDSVPVLSVYLATFLALTTSSLFTSVVVLHIHHLSPEKKLPHWLRRVIFDFLARILCMKSIHARYGTRDAKTLGGAKWRQQLSTYSALPLLAAGAVTSKDSRCVISGDCSDEGATLAKRQQRRLKCAPGVEATAGSSRAPAAAVYSTQWPRPTNGTSGLPLNVSDASHYQGSCYCSGNGISGAEGGCGGTGEGVGEYAGTREFGSEQQIGAYLKAADCQCSAGPQCDADCPRSHSLAGAKARDSDDDFATRSILTEMLDYVKTIAVERLTKDRQEAGREEWRAVAKVIDRLLLFTYIIFIIVATAIILVAQPLLAQF